MRYRILLVALEAELPYKQAPNDYKVVYTGTYVGMRTIGNDVYLNFKETKILVNPFKSAGTASGFSPLAYKFIERIE